jgi:hypothetical protein
MLELMLADSYATKVVIFLIVIPFINGKRGGGGGCFPWANAADNYINDNFG